MAALKYSRQREAIITFLSTRKDHPTADTIYSNLREDFPNISLGTVYRNLSLLTDLGIIMKITPGDGVDHYDYETAPHYHFICQNCHCVQDFTFHNAPNLVRLAQEHFSGEILGATLNFYGYCEDCSRKS